MRFDEAEAPTPAAAVSLFLVEVLYQGMKGMSFTVRDRQSGTDHPTVFVQGGEVCASGGFGAKLRAAEGSRGRWRRRGGTTLGDVSLPDCRGSRPHAAPAAAHPALRRLSAR